MRVSEDAMQDARLMLLERGGPSTVANPEAWVRQVAVTMEIHALDAAMSERQAQASVLGRNDYIADNYFASRRAAKRERDRNARILNPGAERARKARYVQRVGQETINARNREQYARDERVREYRRAWNLKNAEKKNEWRRAKKERERQAAACSG